MSEERKDKSVNVKLGYGSEKITEVRTREIGADGYNPQGIVRAREVKKDK